MAVRYPFGHGLSYTTFEYSDIKLSDTAVGDDDILTVNAVITNTGNCAGKEIVQLYVADKSGFAVRPERSLKISSRLNFSPEKAKRSHSGSTRGRSATITRNLAIGTHLTASMI